MQYIDKNNASKAAFDAVVDAVLVNGRACYRQITAGERSILRRILHAEQGGYCAYCMGIGFDSNLDHVIPQGLDLRHFRSAYNKGHYFGQFIHQDSFRFRGVPVVYYPHTLAYGNIVFSCVDCNSQKDMRVIVPTFFNNPTGVSYDSMGNAHFPVDALDINMRTYLNEDVFRKYRILWSAIKRSNIPQNTIIEMQSKIARIKLLVQIKPLLPQWFITKYPILDVLADDYNWTMLTRFVWFYGYY